MKKDETPGSPEAIKKGCSCAVWDNCYGKGIVVNGERVWWIDDDCIVHGNKQQTIKEKA